LLHGTYDTSTPFRNAVETLAHFPNAALVTIHGGSHNALLEALEAEPDLDDRIVDWFRGGAVPKDISLSPIQFDPLQ
ncbi:MAG: alpha/beta hydrolase, partial [Pseudomonadota bacterium]